MLQRNPPDPTSIKTTPRKLIDHWFGDRALGSAALREAVELMRRAGWLNNYIPGPYEFDRTMIFVPMQHRYEPIFRCLDSRGMATVPRGLIESRTRCRIAAPMAGMFLASYGLAIIAIDGCNVVIGGTSGGMASSINTARYGEDKPRKSIYLVENATGITFTDNQLNDDLRLRAALAFDDFHADVPGLLDGQEMSVVRSRWRFPAPPPAPSSAAAPRSLDPNEPPF